MHRRQDRAAVTLSQADGLGIVYNVWIETMTSGIGSGNQRAVRVLMIAPTSFFADYGCHVRILEEAWVLQRLGHHVTIVTYHSGNPVPGMDIRRTLSIPWRRDYVVGSSRHKIAFDALLGLKTLQLLTQERFDVVHAHLHEGALIGLVAGRIFGHPVVFDFQGSMTSEMLDHHFLKRQGVGYKLLHWLETQIDRRAPVVLTSTSQRSGFAVDGVRLPASTCPFPAGLCRYGHVQADLRLRSGGPGCAPARVGYPGKP